jgi:hypothetical protein
MLLGIVALLRRRFPLPYAVLGLVFPMCTFAWDYAFEARAYGIMRGGAAVAFACWQAAREGDQRMLALTAITVGLAVPFGLGELVRTLDPRRLDIPVWRTSFAAAAVVTLMYPPNLGTAQESERLPERPAFSEKGFWLA